MTKNFRDYLDNRLYGLTEGQFERMYIKQRGLCAICGCKQRGKKRIGIDHNHITGQLRGLLCGKCNFAIGYLLVDGLGTSLLLSAVKYIDNNS